MSHNENEAVVTLRDLHQDIKAIRTDLVTMMTQRASVTSTQIDHETRLRALERRVWTAAGVAAVFAALIPQIGPITAALGG